MYTANCQKTVGHIFKSGLEHNLVHICKISGSAVKWVNDLILCHLQTIHHSVKPIWEEMCTEVFSLQSLSSTTCASHLCTHPFQPRGPSIKGAPGSEKKTRGRFFVKATPRWTN